jgi:hypothetical protein
MKVLVVNGRKMNSYALTLECSVFFSRQGHDVTFVDSNIFDMPWTPRKRAQREIMSKYEIRNEVSVSQSIINAFKAAKEAVTWSEFASGSEQPWECQALNGQLPLGRLVRSLIARSMGTSNFHLSDCSPTQVYEIAFKSIFSYLQTTSAIRSSAKQIDLGIAHGGRDSYSAGAICAFKSHGIKTQLVESGGVATRWSLFETSPHYSPDFWTRLEKSQSLTASEVQVANWWAERLAGSDHFRAEEWGHTREKNLLPSNLPKKYISFFTTSDFEIPVFEEFDIFPGDFQNQTEAFLQLYKLCRAKNIDVIIRRHPNSVDQSGVDREILLWEGIRDLPGVTYLGPHEKVDSIALARGSRTVFTFKSSVGIESIWLGVPAYALGPARWAWTDSLRAWDVQNLERVLQEPGAVNREHAVRWANMMLMMDYPNTQFERIHGNLAARNSVTVTISRISNILDKGIGVLLRRLVQSVAKINSLNPARR